MLHYGIGALLIILICTIVLSYYYNAEGFATMDAATTTVAPTTVPASTIISTKPGATSGLSSEIAVAAPKVDELPKTNIHDVGILDNNIGTLSIKDTNTDNVIAKKDLLTVLNVTSGKFLRFTAQMGSLSQTQELVFWLVGSGENTPTKTPPIIWKNVKVTNSGREESATIPEHIYKPYIGQVVYLVPKGIINTDEAYATFVVPEPSNQPATTTPLPPVATPTVINPKVEISDTGYDAMKLNKQSNMLNDIQKIIHNEMLSHRTLDVSVKNVGSSGAKKGAKAGTSQCSSTDPQPDMAQYIKKDQIPCYGCTLDY